MKRKGKKIKVIALCVSEEDHKTVKIRAAEDGITIKELILKALEVYIDSKV